MDWVIRTTVRNGETFIRWKFTTKLDHLDFADEIPLLASTRQNIQLKTTRLEDAAERVGLKTNTSKCKVTRMNATQQNPIRINDSDIEHLKTLKLKPLYILVQ